MTASFVGEHQKLASSSLGVSAVASVAGDVLLAWITFDNLTATTPTVTSIAKPAGETATWTKLASHDASSSSSAGGVRGELWGIQTTVAWAASSTYAVNLSGTVAKVVTTLVEVSGVGLGLRATGSGTSTAGTPSASSGATSIVAGDLVFGGGSFENNAAPTGDTDTASGSWSTISTNFTTGGGATSNVAQGYQYKIVTGTATQSYDPVGASDSGAVIAALIPFRSLTPADISGNVGTTDSVTNQTGKSIYPPAVMADSPSAYWRLDDGAGATTLVDSSGHARDMPIGSGTTEVSVAGLLIGDLATAMRFNANAYGRMDGDSTWMHPSTRTVEMLLQPVAADIASLQLTYLMDQDNGASLGSRAFQVRIKDGKLEFSCIIGGPDSWNGTRYVWTNHTFVATSTTSVVAGTTYHLAVTHDGSNIRLYVNGNLEATTPASGTIDDGGTAQMMLGNGQGDADLTGSGGAGYHSANFTGVLDEAAFYGTALSAARITAHYNASIGVSGGSSLTYDTSDSAGLSDPSVNGAAVDRSDVAGLSDPSSVTDAVDRSDATGLTDEGVSTAGSGVSTASDALSLTDPATVALGRSLDLSDIAGATGSTVTSVASDLVDDPAGPSDTVDAVVITNKTSDLGDTLGLADTYLQQLGRGADLSEGVGPTDTVEALLTVGPGATPTLTGQIRTSRGSFDP